MVAGNYQKSQQHRNSAAHTHSASAIHRLYCRLIVTRSIGTPNTFPGTAIDTVLVRLLLGIVLSRRLGYEVIRWFVPNISHSTEAI